MIGNDFEQEIIALFDAIKTGYTINQISTKLNKAYPYVNKKVNEFIEEGIFRKLVVGKSYLCSLNLTNEKATVLLTIHEIRKKESFIRKEKSYNYFLDNLNKLKQTVPISSVLIQDKAIHIILDSIEDKNLLKKHLAEFREFDFELHDKKSYQKYFLEHPEAIQRRIILAGCERYFEMISEVADRLPIEVSKT